MIGIDDAFIFSKAGITLIPVIVDVAKKIRSTKSDPSLQRVIDQLITDTRENAKPRNTRFTSEVKEFKRVRR